LHIKIATLSEKQLAMEDAEEQEPKKYRQNEEDRLNKVKARAKRICFRNWINRMAFEEIDLRTEINKFNRMAFEEIDLRTEINKLI